MMNSTLKRLKVAARNPVKLTTALALSSALLWTRPVSAFGLGWTPSEIAEGLLVVAQQVILSAQMATVNGTVNSEGEQTQSTIKQDGEQTREVIRETSVDKQNNERDIYNSTVSRQQQPAPFCSGDQRIAGQIDAAKTQSVYNGIANNYDYFNNSEFVRNPAKFERDKNEKLMSVLTPNCDPRIAPPISKSDAQTTSGSLSCTPEQIWVAVNLITGRKPLMQPPTSTTKTDAGVHVKSEIDNYNNRWSIIEQALAGTMTEENDLLLKSYQKLAEMPEIKTIDEMSGDSAASRTELFQQQIRTQLLVQTLIGLQQDNRLIAVQASELMEKQRKHINGLIQNLKSQ